MGPHGYNVQALLLFRAQMLLTTLCITSVRVYYLPLAQVGLSRGPSVIVSYL